MKLRAKFLFSALLCCSILLFAQCKKDETEEIPVDELAFTEAEKNLIYSGDNDSIMRIMNYFVHEDSLILRKQSIDVNLNDTAILNRLIKRMKKTLLNESNGVGLAAPQVGINRNIIWVQRLDKAGQPFECYLNAKIILYSNKPVIYPWDGCLSVPDTSGASHRYSAVVVDYDLPDGSSHTELIEGYSGSNFAAIIFQHEIDHLNGTIFLDRL
ncbi:MAG TPA: peptide deformylase [Bacteroidales bacterium]|nr:peptide deformylase [Bacteroidales bacterium]HNZ42519.1 peptide deformylase [Bacteroidales bacterium]HPB25656.1 peptide deformylase [Bacteroidales bacterium]HPI29646.1 peptide deformylase [Bacteroidales bacterium]HQN15995.1 peptide deformylase [Bacteroidales bacterium]